MIKISHLHKLLTCFPLTVKYRHTLADDKTYLYFTDYWFLLRYTVIIYKFTQGNLGAKKVSRSRFQSPVKKKIANCDIGDRQHDPCILKFVSDLWQVSGFLQVLRFPSTIKTGFHDITEILLKVALCTITLTITLIYLKLQYLTWYWSISSEIKYSRTFLFGSWKIRWFIPNLQINWVKWIPI